VTPEEVYAVTMPTTPIFKHVFTVVVLSETDTLPFESLEEIAYAITEGEDIGTWSQQSVDRLDDPDKIRDELIAIGNDGSFFDGPEEQEVFDNA